METKKRSTLEVQKERFLKCQANTFFWSLFDFSNKIMFVRQNVILKSLMPLV